MKKIISVILLCAMLLSLAAVSTVSGTAATVTVEDGNTLGDNRVAVYATTRPVIDGDRDTIWDTASAYKISDNGSMYQMMWDETGTYFLFTLAKADDNHGDYTKDAFDNDNTEPYRAGEKNLLVVAYAESADPKDGIPAINIYDTTKNKELETGSYVCYLCIKPGQTSGCYTSQYGDAYQFQYIADKASEHTKASEIKAKWHADEQVRLLEVFIPVKKNGMFNQGGDVFFGFRFAGTTEYFCGTKQNAINNGMSWQDGFYKVKRVKTLVQDPTVTWRGAQQTTPASDACDVRFITEIADIANYKEAGYEVAVSYLENGVWKNVDAKTLSTTTVYTSLKAGEETLSPSAADRYLMAAKISGVPANTTVIFTVKPYTIAENDDTNTKVYGDQQRFQLTNGVLSPVTAFDAPEA